MTEDFLPEHPKEFEEPNRLRYQDLRPEQIDRIIEAIFGLYEKPKEIDVVTTTYVSVGMDVVNGKRWEVGPDSPNLGLRIFLDLVELTDDSGRLIADDDLRRLIFRAEDTGKLDLSIVQEQLERQMDIGWEPGSYSVFGSDMSLASARRRGIELGFFKPNGRLEDWKGGQ